MALIPSSRYPAQTDTDVGYPQGKARNAGSFQDGTGTPLESDWINDIWGFLQALLDVAGITPSGDPDTVGASQYLQALQDVVENSALAVENSAKANVEGAALCNLQTQTSGTADTLNDVFWDSLNAQFVAAGENGTLITSPHGRTWTARTSGVATTINGVAGNSSILVYVGAGGVIRTSPTGATWTSRTSGVATDLNAVWWQANISLFVAVGASGVILTSPDGITWTSRTSGVAVALHGVTGSATLLVVAGSSGTILTSPDGITWTSRTSGTANQLIGAAWKSDLFAVCGASGTMRTSPDGITWTARTSGMASTLRKMTATVHHFLAAGQAVSASGSVISRDGINWFFLDGLTTQVITATAWSGRVLVAVGAGGLALTSNRVLNV